MNFKNPVKLFLILSVLGLTACNNGNGFDEASTIGNYKSPFADNKVKLDVPQFKTVITSENKKTKVAFDAEADAIPASVLINVACAARECSENFDPKQGRLSCAGVKRAKATKWPEAVNTYSFSYKFQPGETPEEIEKSFAEDRIDSACVVGISNFAEFRLSQTVRTGDPDVQLTNANYAQSPYLDQISFFDNATFINSISSKMGQVKIGVIDGDFFPSNPDIDAITYITDLAGYSESYKIESNKIINIGGAPLPTLLGGHGTQVSELILGRANNNSHGAGVAVPLDNYSTSPKLIAANVYSINQSTGEKTITIDHVNNALLLMTFLKADVINMSLGTRMDSEPHTMLACILKAIGGGSVVVVAAGNDSLNMTNKMMANGKTSLTQAYPASWGADYLGLISVAALNRAGTDLAGFSNFGSANVEIAAPGENMLILGKLGSGTSYSAPLVSGAVAVMAAYYKGSVVTPAQLEMVLFAGSNKLASLAGRVKGEFVLNMASIKTQLSTKALEQPPSSRLDDDGFWPTRSGNSMTYGIRTVTSGLVGDDPSIHVGIWEQLDMSLPPLAEFTARNGIDNFELPFYNFLVGDEGFWVVLYRIGNTGKRIPLSSKLYKFTEVVKTPSIAETNVLGAVNQINENIKGWACLGGRPEHLKVEMRAHSPGGTVVKTYITDVQPKGREYFDACAPFTVMLGFEAPLTDLVLNVPYYFVAIHPTDATKNKVLNAAPIIIEAQESTAPILLNTLKKSIVGDNINIKGSVCWVNQTQPGVLSTFIPNLRIDNNTSVLKYIETNVIGKQPELNNLYQQGGFRLYWHDGHPVPSSPEYSTQEIDHRMWSNVAGPGLSDNWGLGTSVANNNFTLPPVQYDMTGVIKAGIMYVGVVKDAGVTKKWFVDIDHTRDMAYDDTAFENPVDLGLTTTSIVPNSAACSSIGKSGYGEDFVISTTRQKLRSRFNISSLVETRFALELIPFSQEQLDVYSAQLQQLHKDMLAQSSPFIDNLIKTGDFRIELRLAPHSAAQSVQNIQLTGVPNY